MTIRLHPEKNGIRAMGVSECFRKSDTKSILCGVIIRGDLVVDGCSFNTSTVDGDDATRRIISLYRNFRRNDVNVIMISGSVISLYNIIDLEKIKDVTNVSTICIAGKSGKNLENILKDKYSNNKTKIDLYKKIGKLQKIKLKNNSELFFRSAGIERNDVNQILNKFTITGNVPEPIRLSKLFARSFYFGTKKNIYSDTDSSDSVDPSGSNIVT